MQASSADIDVWYLLCLFHFFDDSLTGHGRMLLHLHRILVVDDHLTVGAGLFQFCDHFSASLVRSALCFWRISFFGHCCTDDGEEKQAGGNFLDVHDSSLVGGAMCWMTMAAVIAQAIKLLDAGLTQIQCFFVGQRFAVGDFLLNFLTLDGRLRWLLDLLCVDLHCLVAVSRDVGGVGAACCCDQQDGGGELFHVQIKTGCCGAHDKCSLINFSATC